MNKKIIYLSIAVVVLIISASSVTALVSPPKGIKEPTLSKVWAAIIDLQNQILKIPAGAQGPAGPQGPAGAAGATGATGAQGNAGKDGSTVVTKTGITNGQVDLPTGFTIEQCAVLTSPLWARCFREAPFLVSFSSYWYSVGGGPIPGNIVPGATKIEVKGVHVCSTSDNTVHYESAEISNYLIICQK
jgi:hypothetical protein